MSTESITGWLIHKQASGDTSNHLILFTREKGLLHCLHKGGRTPKKQVLTQPFLPLWLMLDCRQYGNYVRKLESHSGQLIFSGISLFAALYINELIYHVLKPLDPYPELYDRYEFTLKALTATQDRLTVEVLLRRFEWQLLQSCGMLCSFTTDAKTNEAIEERKKYRFYPAEGFTVAPEGFAGQDILAFARDELTNPHVLKAAKLIMRQCIDNLLAGKTLKSRSLFRRGQD